MFATVYRDREIPTHLVVAQCQQAWQDGYKCHPLVMIIKDRFAVVPSQCTISWLLCESKLRWCHYFYFRLFVLLHESSSFVTGCSDLLPFLYILVIAVSREISCFDSYLMDGLDFISNFAKVAFLKIFL